MTESTRLSFALHEQFTLVSLGGPLNERFTVPSIALDDSSLPFIIDTARVERVNSLGLRTWLQWLAVLAKDKRRIYFVRCAPSIVAQANYVANFLGDGRVLSFFAPYWCEACRTGDCVLVKTTESQNATDSLKSHRVCESCGGALQLAEVEEEYFGFMMRRGPVEMPAFARELERALAQLTAGLLSPSVS